MNACRQNFPALPDSLTPILEFIAASAAPLCFDDGTTHRLQLMAEELFTNSLKYGEPAAGSSVSLRLARGEEGIEMTYEDHCIPWDPFAHIDRSHHQLSVTERPVGGLGIALIEGLAARVEYQRSGDCNRCRLWLRG